jgi:hypothetical protein
MSAGKITGNEAGGSGGGVYETGSITMTTGEITGNKANGSGGSGGGVYAEGAFTMTTGEITGNTANGSGGSGGGVYAKGAFTMTTGKITDNKADGSGGGVFVKTNSFTMKGGEIAKNTTYNSSGGGVYVDTDGGFAMYAGTIAGNSARMNGGGVYISKNILKTGGIIYGKTDDKNTSNESNQGQGHAVYLSNGTKKRDATAGAGVDLDGIGECANWD